MGQPTWTWSALPRVIHKPLECKIFDPTDQMVKTRAHVPLWVVLRTNKTGGRSDSALVRRNCRRKNKRRNCSRRRNKLKPMRKARTGKPLNPSATTAPKNARCRGMDQPTSGHRACSVTKYALTLLGSTSILACTLTSTSARIWTCCLMPTAN